MRSPSRLRASAHSATLDIERPAPEPQVQARLDYICRSPLLANCGFDAQSVSSDSQVWLDVAEQLEEQLAFPPFDQQSPAQQERVYQYYLPVYMHIDARIQQHKAEGRSGALVVGISAPQGCGKSTLVEQLELLLAASGRVPATVSVDDFYLTYEEQQKVHENSGGNSLLQFRGSPGSHDVKLGTDTLRSLKESTASDAPVPLPRYDKSAHGGRGTRADRSTWPQVQGPVDVVLFEGWMLGFDAVEQEDAAAVSSELVEVNRVLASYKEEWDSFVDSWVVVKIQDPAWVFKWRLQAEHAMRDRGESGMTDEEVSDFVDRFMPAYTAYLPGLYARGPTTAQHDKTLIIEVDAGRSPVASQPAPVV